MPARARTGSGPTEPRRGAAGLGFTLVELMVVLVGLAALSALALPALLDRTGEAAFRQAGDALVASIAQTRLAALADGHPRQVTAIVENGRWRILVERWGDTPHGEASAERPRRRIVLELPAGVRLERATAPSRARFVGPVLEDESEPTAEVPGAEGWPVALFAADGEGFPGADLVVVDRAGRRARLVIQSAPRRVALEDVGASATEAEAEPSAAEELAPMDGLGESGGGP